MQIIKTLLLFVTLSSVANAKTWSESTNWVTEYLANGGKIEDITGLKKPDNWADLAEWDDMSAVAIQAGELPTHFDWNDWYKLQPVRNQGSCGSCWNFSVTAVFESLVRIYHHPATQYDLAEQEGLSCSGAGSCGGGYFDAFDYMVSHGVGHESQFPYEARDLKCKAIKPIAKLKEWKYIGSKFKRPTTEQLKLAIWLYGPISVDVNASFGSYSSGVFTGCSGGGTNHMVTIEGWTDDNKYSANGGGFWRMRNSWNDSWGDKGYMNIVYKSKNGANCNSIGNVAAYAILEKIEK